GFRRRRRNRAGWRGGTGLERNHRVFVDPLAILRHELALECRDLVAGVEQGAAQLEDHLRAGPRDLEIAEQRARDEQAIDVDARHLITDALDLALLDEDLDEAGVAVDER